MSELELPRDLRLQLKARAHALDPVVLLGAQGLTEAVIKEVDRALNAHELIKVRVPDDDRAARDAIFAALADRLAAARVQMIGKLLVLFRPRPEESPAPAGRQPTRTRRAEAAPARGAQPGRTAKQPARSAPRRAEPEHRQQVRRPSGRSRSS